MEVLFPFHQVSKAWKPQFQGPESFTVIKFHEVMGWCHGTGSSSSIVKLAPTASISWHASVQGQRMTKKLLKISIKNWMLSKFRVDFTEHCRNELFTLTHPSKEIKLKHQCSLSKKPFLISLSLPVNLFKGERHSLRSSSESTDYMR